MPPPKGAHCLGDPGCGSWRWRYFMRASWFVDRHARLKWDDVQRGDRLADQPADFSSRELHGGRTALRSDCE